MASLRWTAGPAVDLKRPEGDEATGPVGDHTRLVSRRVEEQQGEHGVDTKEHGKVDALPAGPGLFHLSIVCEA